MKDFLCKPVQPLQRSVSVLLGLHGCEYNGLSLRFFCPLFSLTILQ